MRRETSSSNLRKSTCFFLSKLLRLCAFSFCSLEDQRLWPAYNVKSYIVFQGHLVETIQTMKTVVSCWSVVRSKQQVGFQLRAWAAAVSSLCTEQCIQIQRVEKSHSFSQLSEYLRDCVMAAGGRVTQHEGWQAYSKNRLSTTLQQWKPLNCHNKPLLQLI